MNVLLFGPPGVGKSTLIAYIRNNVWRMEAGWSALDLEEVYPNNIRFLIPSMVQKTIMGAADLSPREEYPRTLKILLHMPQQEYSQRRMRRDMLFAGKRSQKHQRMEDWLDATHYDYVVDAFGSVAYVAEKIMDIFLMANPALKQLPPKQRRRR